MNLPNKLTTLRLLLAILLVVFYSIFKDYSFVMWIVAGCFIVGSITDFLDGYIARKYNLVTGFGKLMDPLADKILVISTIIILVDYGIIRFFWVSIIVIFRELLVLGVRLASLEGGGEVIAADYLGKAKTLTQMVSMSALIVLQGIINTLGETNAVLNGFMLGFEILFYVSVVLAVVSGFNYFWKNKKFFKTK